ncbi:cupin domain-containing protein [Natronospirillum operosum]|uniref:Cupin domain-containing protein n=1 Tax=Natronospirillum operosum TaxID=2759953 RepID=A0A4Z0W6S3_9GAMM|nr:ChrR family anti-sigma-E factor [Natronospirillum operosum]TGG90750.1 cupin domain-containing protein [Natronospirillum operosum]
MSNFHPDQTKLAEYVAGTLSYHETLLISVHLHYCKECQQAVQRLEALGGVLLDDLPGEPVGEDLLQATLASIQNDEPVHRARREEVGRYYRHPEVPAPLQKLVPRGFDALPWRKLLPHLQVCDIELSPQGPKISLHRIRPGGRIPRHTHRGSEYTVVLKGGFSDALGDYNPGDYLHRDADHEHEPVAAESEECICLTVTEDPLKMTSWKWRWMNPFLS